MAYYIKGGMYSFAKGLHRLTQDLGVSIELNSDVQEIIIDPKFKRADGLRVNGDIRRLIKYYVHGRLPICSATSYAKSFST